MDGVEALRNAKDTFEAVVKGEKPLKELLRAINVSFEAMVYTRKKTYPMKGKKIGPVKERVTVATIVSHVSPFGRRAFLRVVEDLKSGKQPFEKDVELALKAFEAAIRRLERGEAINIR